MRNKHILEEPSIEDHDSTLSVSKNVINSYFDHVFIENKQEEKIEDFRKLVIQHSISHIERSLSEEKGRGFTNCKFLILTPFVGDARAITELIEERFPDYECSNKQKMDQV